jgi:hypothetical protein
MTWVNVSMRSLTSVIVMGNLNSLQNWIVMYATISSRIRLPERMNSLGNLCATMRESCEGVRCAVRGFRTNRSREDTKRQGGSEGADCGRKGVPLRHISGGLVMLAPPLRPAYCRYRRQSIVYG